jgi:hypothetical protein
MIKKEVKINMEEPNLVQEFPEETKKTNWKGILIPSLIILAIVVAGAITGYFFSKRGTVSGSVETKQLIGGAELVQGPNEVGIKDEAAFKDTAQGKIDVNDNEGIIEGSHKLLRPGGPSQTAYLTSSVLDLDQFRGKCVQVWGETFAGQEAGWLMDVGRIKVLDSCPEGI